MAEETFSTWKAFWSIFKGYWISEKKWEAMGLLSLVVALILGTVYLEVRVRNR